MISEVCLIGMWNDAKIPAATNVITIAGMMRHDNRFNCGCVFRHNFFFFDHDSFQVKQTSFSDPTRSLGNA